jgi:hypothetical protein
VSFLFLKFQNKVNSIPKLYFLYFEVTNLREKKKSLDFDDKDKNLHQHQFKPYK